MVFVGAINPPAGDWPEHPYTVIDNTPIIREKPYLFIDDAGRYFVMVPPLRTGGSNGTTWSDTSSTQPTSAPPAASGDPIPMENFHIAHPGKDSAAIPNSASRKYRRHAAQPRPATGDERPLHTPRENAS